MRSGKNKRRRGCLAQWRESREGAQDGRLAEKCLFADGCIQRTEDCNGRTTNTKETKGTV